MPVLKEANKEARLEIVEAALIRMRDNRGVVQTRKEIFSPTTSSSIAQIQESKSSKWQQKVLDRMVKRGLLAPITGAGQLRYTVSNYDILSHVLDDWENGSATELPSYVSPRDVGKTEADFKPPGSKEDDEDDDEEEKPVLGDSLPGLVEALGDAATLSEEEFRKSVFKGLDVVFRGHNSVIKRVDEYQKTSWEGISRLLQVLKDTLEAAEGTRKQQSHIEQRVGSYNKKLEALERRLVTIEGGIANLPNRLSNGNRTVKAVYEPEAVKRLDEISSDLGGHRTTIATLSAQTVALRQSINKLVENSDQRVKLAGLVAKLKQQASDSESLQEMLLELMEDKREPKTEAGTVDPAVQDRSAENTA